MPILCSYLAALIADGRGDLEFVAVCQCLSRGRDIGVGQRQHSSRKNSLFLEKSHGCPCQDAIEPKEAHPKQRWKR